jgi:hypothetical protein
MIDFQSSAVVESANHLAAILPLPAGEGRGEGELFRTRFCIGSGEGELNPGSGRQPALIKVGHVPREHPAIAQPFMVGSMVSTDPKSRRDGRICPQYLSLCKVTPTYASPRGGGVMDCGEFIMSKPPGYWRLCAFALLITPNQPTCAKIPHPYRPIPAKK